MTTITCPHCGQNFGVAEHLYGKRVACTTCGRALDIPSPNRTQQLGQSPFATPQPATQPTALPSAGPRRRDASPNYTVVVACVVGGVAVFCLLIGIGVTAIWRATSPAFEDADAENEIAGGSAGASLNAATNQPTDPPSVPDRFVFRPTFETRLGTVHAGRAFVVNLPHQPVPIALTAIHLLGPAGGLERDVPGSEVPNVIRRVVLEECFDANIQFDIGGAALLIAPAAPLGESSQAGDVAAFWVSDSANVRALPLAESDPVEGESVWVAGPVISGAPPGRRVHAAHVYALEDRKLYYKYENAQIELRATSGAPVLNAQGEVVAINLGGGEMNGDLIGVGNPVSRFRPYVVNAAVNPPAATTSVAAKPSTTSASTRRDLSLVERKAIYRAMKQIGVNTERSLASRERVHQQMIDRMKARPNSRALEAMNKAHERAKRQIIESYDRSFENLAKQYKVTLDRLIEIGDEGDAAGWEAPTDEQRQ